MLEAGKEIDFDISLSFITTKGVAPCININYSIEAIYHISKKTQEHRKQLPLKITLLGYGILK